MMERDRKKNLTAFLVITFSASWVINFIVDGWFDDSLPILYLGHSFSMLMPAAAAIWVLNLQKKSDFKPYFSTIPFRLYLGAVAYPFLMWGCPLIIEILSGQTDFAPPGSSLLYIVVFASLTLNIIPGLGEEFGWRGYLLPMLMKRGIWYGFFIHGIIWGIWHYPIYLAPFIKKSLSSGIGTLDWIYLLQQLLAVTASSITMGFILGWLWLRYKNILLLAVLHAYLDAFRDVFSLLFPGYLTATSLSITFYVFQVLPVIPIVFTKEFRVHERAPKTTGIWANE